MTIIFNPQEKHLLKLISLNPMNLSQLSLALSLSENKIKLILGQVQSLGIAYQLIDEEYYSLPHVWDEIDINDITDAITNLNLNFHYFDVIDSTNTFLKQLSNSSINSCFSEMQTQGRGRFGRHWCSPYGLNIYFSLRLLMPIAPQNLKGLSSVIALAICEAMLLEYPGLALKIKWPNDLMYLKKKLAGILIEVVDIQPESCQVIIGIGINVNSQPEHMPDVTQPWISLLQILGHPVKRAKLLSGVIRQILHFCEQFTKSGFSPFISAFDEKDALKGQKITLHSLSGTAKGLDEDGRLILLDECQRIHLIDSGEIFFN